MPLCSRRAWKTPAGFTTWPTPGCYDDGVVLPRFNPDPQTGRRRGFIMTTIQTQRPTLVYVACFYPDLTAFAGLLLSRHSQHLRGVHGGIWIQDTRVPDREPSECVFIDQFICLGQFPIGSYPEDNEGHIS